MLENNISNGGDDCADERVISRSCSTRVFVHLSAFHPPPPKEQLWLIGAYLARPEGVNSTVQHCTNRRSNSAKKINDAG